MVRLVLLHLGMLDCLDLLLPRGLHLHHPHAQENGQKGDDNTDDYVPEEAGYIHVPLAIVGVFDCDVIGGHAAEVTEASTGLVAVVDDDVDVGVLLGLPREFVVVVWVLLGEFAVPGTANAHLVVEEGVLVVEHEHSDGG